MSTGASSLQAAQRVTPLTKVADYAELTKPRIVVLELVAVVAMLHIATGYGAPESVWSTPLLLAVAIGTGLVAGSANALNQWLERELDARMARTAARPIPSGRVTPGESLAFAVLTLAMGTSTLAMFAGPVPALVAVGTWVVYVAFYTPMKTRSWTNTAIGAISGATPLWIGWTAGGGSLWDGVGLATVAVMYIWQFPHFMAIAWLCRDDYSGAGYRMSTTLDPTGRWAGLQAVFGSAVLLPVSLAPLWLSESISFLVYAPIVFLAGIAMLAASSAFLASRDRVSARRLMRISLLYVPIWLLALWCSGV